MIVTDAAAFRLRDDGVHAAEVEADDGHGCGGLRWLDG